MKKILFSTFVAMSILSVSFMASCSKSNSELIKEYDKAITEQVEAIKSGDPGKIQSASEKSLKIANELKERDLTQEEQMEIANITMKAASTALPF